MTFKKYLTIHGHFYQPPRENPWLEEIEIQDSARPFHDWNERVSSECYEPNSVSRIVDDKNRILDIVNNYQNMSFNIGPTLLSWMEKYAPCSYRRIINADKNSIELYGGHGCAIAQVYNHIIMPLANTNDKYTQAIWGIRDFQKRFGRMPEGIWLAETAVDAQTLEVLIDLGIRYTILSPFQAQCVRKMDSENPNDWHDVSWGSIDPSQPYRYYVEGSDKKKFIDLFFYDGAISKSVAFDFLLTDGEKFARRLLDGYSESRQRTQLVNIATDGESYGHHTKFGDMALSYVLGVKAKDLGFEITNYGQYLEMYPPEYEVDIKPVSSWSCSHGVERWKDDCGCNTGAQPGWNQKWRKPLRDALDYLRDELIKLCSAEGAKYYKDFWDARNKYIDVILDRSEESVNKFLKENCISGFKAKDRTKALKLMEIQRFCMLMYTSCGWFFAEISGIETVQIMKYAARAIQLAGAFSNANFEEKFLNILSKAKSNIEEYGNGKNIYERFVKPSVVCIEQIVCHWAISSLYSDLADLDEIYCYKIKKVNYKVVKNGHAELALGRIEVTSKITLEKWDMGFALLKTPDSEFYCAAKECKPDEDLSEGRKLIINTFMSNVMLETLKAFEEQYSAKFYRLKDVLIDKRKTILDNVLKSRLTRVANTYEELFEELKVPVAHLANLGMDIPDAFRVSAKFCLIKNLQEILTHIHDFRNEEFLAQVKKIEEGADKFFVNLNKSNSGVILAKKLQSLIDELSQTMDLKVADEIFAIFDVIDILQLNVEIKVAQNIYFEKIYSKINILVEHLELSKTKDEDRQIALTLLEVGKKLNINTDFYRPHIDKASLPFRSA